MTKTCADRQEPNRSLGESLAYCFAASYEWPPPPTHDFLAARNFLFWETPLTFTKTYSVGGSSSRSDDRGPGTLERPFRTIGKAAEVLRPGERVVRQHKQRYRERRQLGE